MHSTLSVVIWIALSTLNQLQVDAQCVDHLHQIDRPGFRVDLDEPLTYYDAYYKCKDRGVVVPSRIDMLRNGDDCGGQLVPLNDDDTEGCLPLEWPNDTLLDYSHFTGNPGFNVTSGECSFLDTIFLFNCVLCQLDVIRFPYKHILGGWEDYTTGSYFIVRLTSVDVRQTTEFDLDALQTELKTLLDVVYKDYIEFYRVLTDESQHLQIEFRVHQYIMARFVGDNVTTGVLNDTFTMIVEDVDFCPAEESVHEDGTTSLWPRTLTGDFEVYLNHETGEILQRFCHFDVDAYHGRWDAIVTLWELVYRPCESLDDQYINEEHYKLFLDAVDIDTRHANMLHDFTTAPVDSTAFNEVTRLVGREMELKNELNEQIIRDLATVTANLDMNSDLQVVAMAKRAYLIVADIDSSDPVVGFGCICNGEQYDDTDSITVEKAPMPKQRNATIPFTVEVSPTLMAASARVAFVLLWKHMPLQSDIGRTFEFPEVSVMFPLERVSPETIGSYGKYHVDITYFPTQLDGDYKTESHTELTCVAWDNNALDWTSLGCQLLDVDLNGSSTCRCSGKYFVLDDGVPIGKYALQKNLLRRKRAYYNNLINFAPIPPVADSKWEQGTHNSSNFLDQTFYFIISIVLMMILILIIMLMIYFLFSKC